MAILGNYSRDGCDYDLMTQHWRVHVRRSGGPCLTAPCGSSRAASGRTARLPLTPNAVIRRFTNTRLEHLTSREIDSRDGTGRRADLAVIYQPTDGWDFLKLARAIVVPEEALERAKAIVGPDAKVRSTP
jgi:hypothetical protein